MLDRLVKSVFNSVRNCHAACQSDHIASPPVTYESSFRSTSSSAFGVVRVLDSGYSNRGVVASLGGFNWPFPDDI